ncbi:hypothetical protein FRX31_006151 [Thalictrum thalictroides]|uniref:O-acyltransferase WSD1 C-terminal domain-containing protein n=1 Tax=Thalictrum thalictroides TaxID=46969 RepID=A0A7J6X7C1_THATH|nr:hypothetical protein FRX31_006151 [Thalictrum thalictroides]
MAGHPCSSFYYVVAGIPQSLVFTIGSYKGQLNITATTEKNFIDTQLFKSCMMEAFNNIYDAACFRRA